MNQLNEKLMRIRTQIMKLDYELEKAQKEKDSLVRVIDENLLKGYHEQSLKHKEAKEKKCRGNAAKAKH
ncbi:hypothetical protein [Methanobrevibacter sp.]|uniref:hypothetical protein n=1 Tax=Methanobrevibacter sp. TaxID=66852 RepID=UPI0038635A95